MEQRNFKFNFTFEGESSVPLNNNEESTVCNETQTSHFKTPTSLKDDPSNQVQNASPILTYKLDKNEIFNEFYNESTGGSKIKDLFWNRVVLKQFNFQDEDLLNCFQTFTSEFTVLLKNRNFPILITAMKHFYSICSNVFNLFHTDRKPFVTKFMKKITSFYPTLLNALSDIFEELGDRIYSLPPKELLITPYGQYLRLFTGILFMNARSGYAKRIFDGILSNSKSAIMKPNGKNMFGAGTGFQWTWALVYFACIECSSDSILPNFLHLNTIEWAIEQFQRNVDTIPYMATVLYSIQDKIKTLNIRSTRFLMELYLNCPDYKAYIYPIFERFFGPSEYRIINFDSDDYYISSQSTSYPQHITQFLLHLNYYDTFDREILIHIFKNNRELYAWYWRTSPNMENILTGRRQATWTPTCVARLNFLYDLLKIPLSAIPSSSDVNTLKEFCLFSIWHPKWNLKQFADRLFLFPSQDNSMRRVSIRIAAFSVLHAMYQRYQSLEEMISLIFKNNDYSSIVHDMILEHFLFPIEDYLKMINSPYFLYMWPLKVDIITFRPRTHAFQYAAALALKLFPYYQHYFPNSENTYHYDLLISSIPVNTYTAEIWANVLFNTRVQLGWERVEVAHASNFILNAFPSWKSNMKLMKDGMKFASRTPAEIYFWNRCLYHQYIPRYYNFFNLNFSHAIKKSDSIENKSFSKSEHSLKFAIINAMKSILSVTNTAESLDFISRMTRHRDQYPEIIMFLSKPVQNRIIDPKKSKFQVTSLVSSNKYDYLARMCHVPLFDIAAKLPEIHTFSKSLNHMELFWRACMDICHVTSIFDLVYLHGWSKTKEMMKDLPFNALLIQISRTFNQISLFDVAEKDLFLSASISLVKEPTFMLPFYITQILKSMLQCHRRGLHFYHRILLQVIYNARRVSNPPLDFDRCFSDVILLEKLLHRSSLTASILLNLIENSIKMRTIHSSNIFTTLIRLCQNAQSKFDILSPRIIYLISVISNAHSKVVTVEKSQELTSSNSNLEEDIDLSFHTKTNIINAINHEETHAKGKLSGSEEIIENEIKKYKETIDTLYNFEQNFTDDDSESERFIKQKFVQDIESDDSNDTSFVEDEGNMNQYTISGVKIDDADDFDDVHTDCSSTISTSSNLSVSSSTTFSHTPSVPTSNPIRNSEFGPRKRRRLS